MCQSDKDKPAATESDASGRHLATIARLLNVPPSVFALTPNALDDGADISSAEPGQLLTLYLDLLPEPRRKLLAYARQLARGDGHFPPRSF